MNGLLSFFQSSTHPFYPTIQINLFPRCHFSANGLIFGSDTWWGEAADEPHFDTQRPACEDARPTEMVNGITIVF
jgi:hypothetical protein